MTLEENVNISVGSLCNARHTKKPEVTPRPVRLYYFSSAQAVSTVSAAQSSRCSCCSRPMVAAWWSVSSHAAETISSLLLLVVMEGMEQMSRVYCCCEARSADVISPQANSASCNETTSDRQESGGGSANKANTSGGLKHWRVAPVLYPVTIQQPGAAARQSMAFCCNS